MGRPAPSDRAAYTGRTRSAHALCQQGWRGGRNWSCRGSLRGRPARCDASDGWLYLIDPFHLSRIPALNFLKRAARRAVNSTGAAQTRWIESFSQDAIRDWKFRIDFLLIDGDHREEAVERDWQDWSP